MTICKRFSVALGALSVLVGLAGLEPAAAAEAREAPTIASVEFVADGHGRGYGIIQTTGEEPVDRYEPALVPTSESRAEIRFLSPIETNETAGVTFPVDGLVEGVQYRLFVRAVNAAGWAPGFSDLFTTTAGIHIVERTIPEGASEHLVQFAVRVDSPASVDRVVRWRTVAGAGTAQAGTDYVADSGELVIRRGQTSAQFKMTILGDRVQEALATETLVLEVEGGPVLGASRANITINEEALG